VFTEAGSVRDVAAYDETLWVATGEGLVTWDLQRKQVRVLTIDDGLPGNDIRTLAQGADKALWVGTATGIARYRGGSLTQFGDCPLGEGLTAMATAGDGTLYVGGQTGLVRLQGEAWKTLLEGIAVTGLHWDTRASALWVGTQRKGILRCQGTRCTSVNAERLGSLQIRFLVGGPPGVLAIVGPRRQQLLYHHRGRWHRYRPDPVTPLRWAHFARGKLLLGTARGTFELTERVEPETPDGPLELDSETRGAPEFISRRLQKQLPRHVTTVQKALGWLWIGSRSLGVARFNGDALQYFRTNGLTRGAHRLSLRCPPRKRCLLATGARLFRRTETGWNALSYTPEINATVQWIGRDHRSDLVVVRNGRGGLDVARRQGQRYQPLELDPALRSEQGPLTAAFAKVDPRGKLWIGLRLGEGENQRGVGVAVVSLDTGAVTIHGRGADLPRTEGSLGIHPDLTGVAFRERTTYLASRRGVIQIDPQGTVQTFTENHGLRSELIQDIAVTPAGQLYIATPGGLGRYDGRVWHFTGYGPRASRVQTLATTRDGSLWFGSDTGLHHLIDGEVQSWDESDGLLQRSVRSLALDPRGRVWALHATGLSILTPPGVEPNPTEPAAVKPAARRNAARRNAARRNAARRNAARRNAARRNAARRNAARRNAARRNAARRNATRRNAARRNAAGSSAARPPAAGNEPPTSEEPAPPSKDGSP
jgi:hypothetical protein